MVLSNSQYDAIMRDYDARQDDDRHDLELRTAEVFLAVPKYKEVLDDISELSFQIVKENIKGHSDAADALRAKLSERESMLPELLVNAGFPTDYLKMRYTCPSCKDTGYVNNRKCSCFKQATIDLLYNQSNIRDILQKENFNFFSFDCFSKDYTDPSTGLTPYDNMQRVYSQCLSYVENFPCGEDILFYGSTGVGKTFLSNCIAKALLDKSFSVLYMTAVELFDYMSAHMNAGGYGRDNSAHNEQILDCDLLIIDDLGTELSNTFTDSKLFHVLNSRQLTGKSTIISTNFSLSELMNTYSERIFSRISGSYKLFKLYGDDIRLKK